VASMAMLDDNIYDAAMLDNMHLWYEHGHGTIYKLTH
jgi:ABC-type polysaccharide transport system permease subunit